MGFIDRQTQNLAKLEATKKMIGITPDELLSERERQQRYVQYQCPRCPRCGDFSPTMMGGAVHCKQCIQEFKDYDQQATNGQAKWWHSLLQPKETPANSQG